MKYTPYFLFLLLALNILTSCKEDDNGSLLITSTTQLHFGSDGGSQTFRVESNTDWVIASSSEWLSVTPVSGNKNQEVTVSVAITDNQLEEESKLVIHTTDGEKVVNIKVQVEGSYIKTGSHLDVRNHSTRFYLGGKAGEMDSLRIRANIAWEIKGPDWIEAWDGTRWRTLSPNRGIVKGHGSELVYVRAASDNKDEDGIEGIITISEQFTGEHKYTVNVEQMGRLETRPSNVQTLADCIAFEWICGCDVEKIYFRITDKEMKGASIEEVRQNFDVTYPDYINSIDDMTPNVPRILEARCEDSQGNMGTYQHYYTMHSAKGQVRAKTDIVTAKRITESQWRIFTKPDEETLNYYEYVTDNPNSAFIYNTPILYHIYVRNLEYAGIERKFNTAGYADWNMQTSSNEIHVLTMSRDLNGKLSDYINRYDCYYDANGNELSAKPLLDRIPKSKVNDISLR